MDAAITIVMLVPILLAVALIVGVIRRNITERQAGGPVDIRGAIPAVIVLLVAVLVIGSMACVAEDRDFELYDCVPVSDLGSGISVEGDCAEIVTIGGEDYVRMKAVGTFSVVSGGSSRECTVGPAHLDLVVLTGQSNSVYYTAPQYYEGDSPVAPGKAFYLGGPASIFDSRANLAVQSSIGQSSVMDLVAPDGSVNVAQMYPAFCSGYVKETGHRLLVVNTGIGNRSVAAWDDGGECDLWMASALERVSELASDGSIVLTPTVALWSQGESDAEETSEFYESHLIPLLEKLWGGHYSGYAFRDVLSVLPRFPNHANPIPPASAQMEIADEASGFRIASSLPMHFTASQTRDGVHYTQEAYGWLGEAFARSAASALGFRPSDQSIVLADPVGEVTSLPRTVTAYGTSGQGFGLSATWEPAGNGTYYATLKGNPYGTVLGPMTVQAVLI